MGELLHREVTSGLYFPPVGSNLDFLISQDLYSFPNTAINGNRASFSCHSAPLAQTVCFFFSWSSVGGGRNPDVLCIKTQAIIHTTYFISPGF